MDAPPAPARRLTGLRRRARALVGEAGSPRRVLVRNGAWESGTFLLHAVVLFFLSPFLVHRLGNSAYGVWELVLALVGYLGFADLGVRPAIVHFVARHDARGEMDVVNRYVSTAFVVFGLAGLGVMAVATPLAFGLPGFWRIAPDQASPATVALLLVAAETALALPLNALSAVLVGKQRYDLMGGIRVASIALRTTGVVLVLTHDGGLVALALVHAGVGLFEMVAFAALAFRVEPRLRLSLRRADRAAARGLLGFGGWALVVMAALQVTWATDPLVIGRALSDEAVALFAIGFKLALHARDLLRVAARVVEPAAGALDARGERGPLLAMLTGTVRWMLLLAGPVLAYLLVVGEPFLGRWMGAGYREPSGAVLRVMTLAVLPAIASFPLVSLHYGTNRLRPLAILTLLEAGLNLVLSIALVGRFGLVGVAWGTAIPAFLVHLGLLPWTVCRRFGLSWASFLWRTWTGPVVVGAVTTLVLRALVRPDAVLGWPALLLLAAAAVAVHAAATLLLRRLAPALLAGRPAPVAVEAAS